MTEQTEAQLIAAKLDANPDLLQEARGAVCAVVADALRDEIESGADWYELVMDGLGAVSSYTTTQLADEIARHMEGEETTLEKWIANAKASAD